MSQHDYNIANGGGAAVRADINNALAALLSQNSGATAPTTTAPFMPWYDTSTGVLKFRNAANTAWVSAVEAVGGSSGVQFRNRIINGDMRIDQRNAGASVTGNDGVFSVDRWVNVATQTSKYTMQQNSGSVTPPAGFSNYLGIVSSSAFSVAAGDFFQIRQRIEGFNTTDLAWGTASAQAATLSFWVRSSLTGTFGGSVNNSAFNRSYPFSYTISAANTWEYKTVTIAGDTSGTWLGGNSTGIQVGFSLGSGTSMSGTAGSWSGSAFSAPTGSVSVVGTNGATFFITGVQLEAGTVATPFERRPYGTELALCQRYCEVIRSTTGNYAPIAAGQVTAATRLEAMLFFKTTKRSASTLTFDTAANFVVSNSTGAGVTCTAMSTNRVDVDSVAINCDVASGLTAGNASRLFANNTANPFIIVSSEL